MPSEKNFRRVVLAVCACLVPVLSSAQTGGAKPLTDVPVKNAAPTTTQTMPPGVLVTQAFTQRGVNKCADRIGQFAQFLTNGAEMGGQVFVAPDDPDRRLSSASLEIQAGQAVNYAGMTFAPDTGANRCGGMYELVTYWPNTCDDVATRAYSGYKRTSPLHKVILALEGGATVRVFLLPAGSGCVAIKKELVY